jgi:hypothetical protein
VVAVVELGGFDGEVMTGDDTLVPMLVIAAKAKTLGSVEVSVLTVPAAFAGVCCPNFAPPLFPKLGGNLPCFPPPGQ